MRDFNITQAIPLFAALWDGFSFWDFFVFTVGEISMDEMSIRGVLSRLDSAVDDLKAMHTLQALRCAEIGSWSPLLPSQTRPG